MITLRDSRQIECYNKAKDKNSFLIAAICRFGKTYVASKLLHDAWNASITVILSGINVRNEWRQALEQSGFHNVVTTNEELNNLDLSSLDPRERYVFFVSSQKAGMGLYERDSTAIPSNIQLIESFNSFPGTKVLCFDESHFAEQTERSQLLVSQYHADKKLYISGTPYTNSLTKQFSAEDRYQYTYVDLKRDYDAGKLPFKPVLLNMYILDKFLSTDEDCIEDWSALFADQTSTRCLVKRTIQFAKDHEDRNNLIVCNRTRDAELIVRLINSNEFSECNVKAMSAAGDASRTGSDDATKFFDTNDSTTNFIVTCDRLCTGSTIPPLQAVMFYCPTQSVIKFIQTSMRCCSPWANHEKDSGDVVCFNKFGAFSIYATLANLELRDKATTQTRQDDYEELQRTLPLFIEDNLGLRRVEYAEATNFEALYVHGKTRFFTDFSDLADFNFFSFNKQSLKALSANIAKAIKKDQKDVEKVLSAAAEVSVEEVTKTCRELLGSDSPKVTTQEINEVESARERLQKAFTCVIEACVITRSIDSDYNIDYNQVSSIILDIGFCSVEKFKYLVDLHPEYVRCIVNYCNVQLTNLGGSL